ncbi:hypothetical protein NM208_g10639 [Fusarium decemcellulare]|uniref:Uncharacterized protein n=1 Tax=Fusarium decemcellulare TaxID=57161 RepID=A0ACC1RX52_9HYPO|nr:hypothetical protein NM208_g10639 [Fusarium decemcellulare]
MPPKASPASAWQGAPPVAEDGFAFANGDFFAEASGHNRHRRATPQELQTHFASGSDKDHPAHWFEAQLVHYGLQPSKTKGIEGAGARHEARGQTEEGVDKERPRGQKGNQSYDGCWDEECHHFGYQEKGDR